MQKADRYTTFPKLNRFVMKKMLLVMPMLLATALTQAAPATASSTLELSVEGLNCSLCSEEMKGKLKRLAGATDIEHRLECGKIYLDMPQGARLNENNLTSILLSNGFTYQGAKPSAKSLSDVRKTSPDAC